MHKILYEVSTMYCIVDLYHICCNGSSRVHTSSEARVFEFKNKKKLERFLQYPSTFEQESWSRDPLGTASSSRGYIG